MDTDRTAELLTRDVHDEQPRPRAIGEPSLLALWVGIVLAPLAVLANIGVNHALAPVVCERWPKSMLHIVVALALLVCVAGGLVAHRTWVSAGRGWPLDAANPIERSRFMGMVGMMVSALCILLVLSQWLAPLMLRPCQ